MIAVITVCFVSIPFELINNCSLFYFTGKRRKFQTKVHLLCCYVTSNVGCSS